MGFHVFDIIFAYFSFYSWIVSIWRPPRVELLAEILRYCYWRSEVLIKMLKLFGRVRVISMSSKLRFHIHYINVPKMLFPGSPAAPSTTRRWRNNRELSGIYSHRHPVRKTIMRWLIWNTFCQRRYCDKCRV